VAETRFKKKRKKNEKIGKLEQKCESWVGRKWDKLEVAAQFSFTTKYTRSVPGRNDDIFVRILNQRDTR